MIADCSQCGGPAKFKIHADGSHPSRYLCQKCFQNWVDANPNVQVKITMYAGATLYAGRRTDGGYR